MHPVTVYKTQRLLRRQTKYSTANANLVEKKSPNRDGWGLNY